MSDRELRSSIVNTLKNAKNAMTFEEIADNITLDKDYWRISAILNQLMISGIISEVKEPYKSIKYIYVR
jgi:predicted transcriptional regulator